MNAGNLMEIMNSTNISRRSSQSTEQSNMGEKSKFQDELGKALDSRSATGAKAFKKQAGDSRVLNRKSSAADVEKAQNFLKNGADYEDVKSDAEEDVIQSEAGVLMFDMFRTQDVQLRQPDLPVEVSRDAVAMTAEQRLMLMGQRTDASVETEVESNLPKGDTDKLAGISIPVEKAEERTQTRDLPKLMIENQGSVDQIKTATSMKPSVETQVRDYPGDGQTEEDNELLKDDETTGRPVFVKSGLDSSKVNIKVADAPIDVYGRDMNREIMDRIMHKLSEGKHIFDIELNPRSLGKINIKLIFQNGGAEMIMTTASSKAHQLMTMNAEALRGILESATGLNSSVQVKEGEGAENLMQQSDLNGQNQNKQQSEHQKRRDPDSSADFIERLRLRLTSGLDMAEAVQ